MMDLVERLRSHIGNDHVRGCMGRQYSCDCGFDLTTEGLLELAADEIERLRVLLREGHDITTYDGNDGTIAYWRSKARAALSSHEVSTNKGGET